MLRRTLLVSSSLLVLASCNVPEKPVVKICVIDYPRMEAICGESGGDGSVTRVPLSDLDKATSFAPAEWEKVQNYMDELRDYIRNNCRGSSE